MEKQIRFTLRLVASLDKALAKIAKETGHSKTGVITQALWEHVKVKQKDKTA